MAKVKKINSEIELIRYLQGLSEASAKFQDDPRQVYFMKARKDDQQYYNLDEEDEEKSPPPKPDAQGQTAPQGQELENPPDRQSSLGDEKQSFAKDLNVSLDSISSAIKKMRGGRSVDDSAIESELRVYFDRLDDPSRKAMFVFFKSFADILTGQTTGASAQDPEDPPLDLKIEDEPDAETPAPKQAEPTQGTEEEEEEETQPEDTSAPAQLPIAVGKQQVKESVKLRLARLMRR